LNGVTRTDQEPTSATLTVSVLLSMLLGAPLALAGATAEVGVVISYTPDAADLYLTRQGVSGRIPVRIATLVQTGDQIVLPAQSTVTVELADDQRIVSAGPGSWTVPAAAPMGSIATLIHRFEFALSPGDVRTVTAITRSAVSCTQAEMPKISVPSLGPDAHIVSGKRGLSLAWNGGCPPYDVELWLHAHITARKSGLSESEVRFDTLDLTPGKYELVIRGSTGATARFPLTVAADLPKAPNELVGNASHLAIIARAMWLASAADGNWRLDSIESLIPLARNGDRLAEWAIDRLLWIPISAG
jgi:hypothetical protein